MADNPPYLFRDTPEYLIEQHYRRLTTFTGYSEPEILQAEARLGARFPAVFREYLRKMAKSPGELFTGSDLAGIADFEQFAPRHWNCWLRLTRHYRCRPRLWSFCRIRVTPLSIYSRSMPLMYRRCNG